MSEQAPSSVLLEIVFDMIFPTWSGTISAAHSSQRCGIFEG